MNTKAPLSLARENPAHLRPPPLPRVARVGKPAVDDLRRSGRLDPDRKRIAPDEPPVAGPVEVRRRARLERPDRPLHDHVAAHVPQTVGAVESHGGSGLGSSRNRFASARAWSAIDRKCRGSGACSAVAAIVVSPLTSVSIASSVRTAGVFVLASLRTLDTRPPFEPERLVFDIDRIETRNAYDVTGRATRDPAASRPSRATR